VKQVKNKPGRAITMPAPWGDLFKSVGGQKRLADKLGVSKSTVGKWATDVHRVPAIVKKELLRLCKYYGIEEGISRLQS
jgi:transcriptional regulator with XRE-family HTH domain